MDERVLAETLVRFEERSPQRQRVRDQIRAGHVEALDSPERMEARQARLRVTAPETAVLGLERIIGASNLIEFSFLQRGTAVGAAVGRIVIATTADVIDGYGTGVLVSPRLLLTNNHVLRSPAEAERSTLELGYEESPTGALQPPDVYRLDPDALFVTDQALDFTLVAVAPTSHGGRPLSGYGFVPLIGTAQGKVVRGEWLNIIQHADGEPKSLALRDNRLFDVLDGFLHYETDTSPGSSGSPVFNDQWELVALHHSGVPERDHDGNILTTDGRVWTAPMGESAVRWVANEGIRISRIVDRISREHLTGTAAQLRDDLLAHGRRAERAPASGPTPALPALPVGSATAPLAAIPAQTVGPIGPAQAVAGGASFTIPLQITVQVAGSPALAVIDTPVPAVPPRPADGGERRPDGDTEAALAELGEAPRRPYYDRAADQAAAATYYASVGPTPTFADLSGLTRVEHRQKPRYAPARELYPWVDLQPDLRLRSLYTGTPYAPETFILEDARVTAQRIVGAASREALGHQDDEAFLEATLPYNCEHVVPQSWFDRAEPMRGDLHHLFACESGCNSFRGNIPYFDFVDFDEAIRHGCGRREAQRFEPSNGKGAAARATLYFLVRYPGVLAARELPPERIEALLGWHRDTPPDTWEQHRNQAIYVRQGNRNPFIDHPDWADGIDFTQAITH